MAKKIKRNALKCLICGDVIESKGHRHTMVECSCGNCYVDGSLEYLRRGAMDFEKTKDLSKWE